MLIKWFLSLLLFVLFTFPAHAAYLDQGTILRYEQDGDGSARLIVRFTGDAGEPIVDKAYPISSGSSFQALRRWVRANVEELNLKRTAGTAPPGGAVNRCAGSRRCFTDCCGERCLARESGELPTFLHRELCRIGGDRLLGT